MVKKFMKKNKILSIMLTFILFIVIFGEIVQVSAATYGSAASSGTYTYIGRKTVGKVDYQIYKNSKSWICYYPGKKVTTNIYHVKGHGDDVLAFSTSQTLSKTSTTSWSANASITASGSIDFIMFSTGVSVGAGLGYGEMYARGYTFSKANTVSKTIKDSANTGYYSRVPGYTFYKMKCCIRKLSSIVPTIIYYDAPYGDPVLYTIYSPNNSSWSIY